MKMFEDLSAIDEVLRNDIDLWKLLYHESKHFDDDPLDKDNILEYPPEEMFPIIKLRLKHTPVTKDLANIQINRIIFYPAPRRSQRGNYATASQEVNFDIFCHRDFNDIDMRLSKLCDRVNELISNRSIAGIGKATFVSGNPFTLADEGYIGYKLTYAFRSLT